jgi:hypothetical protein
MGKVLSRAKKFYVDNLKFLNDGKLDREFKLVLQILYFFGWYQPQPTKLRIVYGVCTFCGVLVTWSLGFTRYTLAVFQDGELFKGLLNMSLTTLSVSVLGKVASVAFNSKNISEYLGELHELHEYYNNGEIQVLSKKCYRVIKVELWFFIFATLVVCLQSVIGYELFKLIVPAIYDVLATSPLYYVLMVINAVHLGILATVVVVCDLLPNFCIARIVKNQSLVAHEFKHCTDDVDREKNIENLEAGAKYYAAIRR